MSNPRDKVERLESNYWDSNLFTAKGLFVRDMFATDQAGKGNYIWTGSELIRFGRPKRNVVKAIKEDRETIEPEISSLLLPISLHLISFSRQQQKIFWLLWCYWYVQPNGAKDCSSLSVIAQVLYFDKTN